MNKRLTFYQFLTVLTVFFFSIKLSAQTTYYVDVSGNDVPGANPYATLTYALRR